MQSGPARSNFSVGVRNIVDKIFLNYKWVALDIAILGKIKIAGMFSAIQRAVGKPMFILFNAREK